MAIVTGDRYVELLVNFVEKQAGSLLDGTLILKLNPVGLHYVQSRLEALQELERLRTGAPVDYLRAYIADLGDYRALEQLRRVLRLLTSLKVVSVLPHPFRDPTPLSLLPFGRLRFLELRGCDLSTSAARGLLELRHTLERIICHNSTDALRHLFAGRIVDIQDCPVWPRLYFVSCAGNNIVLMDESLQLIPAVETLDLSRNRFAKIANLQRCTKLKHLDLGFNHIRTISSLNEVTCGISNLILRNNVLTTLRGIENLTSLEGVDLSFNMISNFDEIELLATLPSLESLWLEGNPICYAGLYRQQVFSFFSNLEKLKLDEKAISGREAWTVKVIVARRQKQRAGYGVYAPAKDEMQSEAKTDLSNPVQPGEANSSGGVQPKTRNKIPRLALIDDPESKRHLVLEGVEQDDSCSPSCESESQRRDETDTFESNKYDALQLMNRIEAIKNEKSSASFRELKELLDQNIEERGDYIEDITCNPNNQQSHMRTRRRQNQLKDSCKASVDGKEGYTDHCHREDQESKLLQLGHDAGNAYQSMNHSQENCLLGNLSLKAKSLSESLGSNDNLVEPSLNSESREIQGSEDQLKVLACDVAVKVPRVDMRSSFLTGNVANEEIDGNENFGSLKAIDEIVDSRPSSCCHGSPPHYQEDILHRRQNLEEEFMQLSLDSYSLASSTDSETSDDDYNYCLSDSSGSVGSQTILHANAENDVAYIESDTVVEVFNGESDKIHHSSSVKQPSLDANGWPDSNAAEASKMDHAIPSSTDDILADAGGGRLPQTISQGLSCTYESKVRRKPKKRVIVLDEEKFLLKSEQIEDASSSLRVSCSSLEKSRAELASAEDGFESSVGRKELTKNSLNGVKHMYIDSAQTSVHDRSMLEASVNEKSEDPIKLYFYLRVADAEVSESCLHYVCCSCMCLWEDDPGEREVAVLLSCESKLYILLTSSGQCQPGTVLNVLGSHMLQDIRNVTVGMGLQALRVHIGHSASYLFVTRSIAKSRELFSMLEKSSCGAGQSFGFLLQSWEHVQISLFEKHVLGGFRMSIILYAMLLFCQGNQKDSAWFARSLFLTADYIFLCVEDLMYFGSVSEVSVTCEPYFYLEAWSSISSILELVSMVCFSCQRFLFCLEY
eukprot:Gb_29205 [translate_table: standard]